MDAPGKLHRMALSPMQSSGRRRVGHCREGSRCNGRIPHKVSSQGRDSSQAARRRTGVGSSPTPTAIRSVPPVT